MPPAAPAATRWQRTFHASVGPALPLDDEHPNFYRRPLALVTSPAAPASAQSAREAAVPSGQRRSSTTSAAWRPTKALMSAHAFGPPRGRSLRAARAAAVDADDQPEHVGRIPPGEQDCEPCDDGRDQPSDPQEPDGHDVRNRQDDAERIGKGRPRRDPRPQHPPDRTDRRGDVPGRSQPRALPRCTSIALPRARFEAKRIMAER